jgi:hypothetical protein
MDEKTQISQRHQPRSPPKSDSLEFPVLILTPKMEETQAILPENQAFHTVLLGGLDMPHIQDRNGSAIQALRCSSTTTDCRYFQKDGSVVLVPAVPYVPLVLLVLFWRSPGIQAGKTVVAKNAAGLRCIPDRVSAERELSVLGT